VTGFVDLHCHWVWDIDDGARSAEEGLTMLRRLGEIGFGHVVATPHMRPGLFEGRSHDLRRAYQTAVKHRARAVDLPETSLGSEHFFDTDIITDVLAGRGLPYAPEDDDLDAQRTGGALLVEFSDLAPLGLIEQQLFQLQTAGFIPVIAHPERYRAVWADLGIVRRLVDLGSIALLDIAALLGKYGARAQEAAEELLREGVYDAACTDSHRPADVDLAERAIALVRTEYGEEEVNLLLAENPRRLLTGHRPEHG